MKIANKKMKHLLEEMKKNNKSSSFIKVDKLSEILFLELVEIDDCLVISFNGLSNLTSTNFNNILKNYYDMTDFETSHNELRINSYIDYEEKNIIDVLKLGVLVQLLVSIIFVLELSRLKLKYLMLVEIKWLSTLMIHGGNKYQLMVLRKIL